MKSQVNLLLCVTKGLLKDVLSVYPALKGLDLDLENLSIQCQTRGQALFTLDLPNLDSCLLAGLESGRLQLSGPFTRKVSKRVRVPRLFAGLWLRVFDNNADLKPDADVNAIFFLRCLTTLGKRIEVECSDDRIRATQLNYHNIERSLRDATGKWHHDILGPASYLQHCHLGDAVDRPWPVGTLFCKEQSLSDFDKEKLDLLNRIQCVSDLIVSSWPRFDPITYSGDLEREGRGIGFKHGRGAVAERLPNWEKSRFVNWSAKLDNTFPWGLCGTTAGSTLERPSYHEPCSRLMCVPKTAKSPRLIASEPTSHMWCQQALLSWFETQFKESFDGHFIDLNNQRKSGDMVLSASKTRKYATVDLSDASDRVTCWTVERIFRRNPSVVFALHAARTRYIRDSITDVQNFLKPKKFASQGTATTFPVMSFIMLCIALGSCIQGDVTWSKIRKLRRHVRVYGDDIIVPTYGYARLVSAMDLLQLKVNMAKSYVTGHFRESCGVDGFKGHDVTPVRPKTLVADSPTSCVAVVDTTNNFLMKGLWHASISLEAHIPLRIKSEIRIVGPRDVGLFGLGTFGPGSSLHLKTRWSVRYQRPEVRVWALRPKHRTRERHDFSALLDFVSISHSTLRPRLVSEYREVAKASRGTLRWESHYSNDEISGTWRSRCKVRPL